MESLELQRFVPLMKFIVDLMPNTEVVLYDVISRTVFHVINPLDEEMTVGSPMRSVETHLLDSRAYEKLDFVTNYRALSKRQNKLKSATLFLRSPVRKLVGILTVNQNVDQLVEFRDFLNTLVSGQHPYDEMEGPSFYNSFDISVSGMVSSAIRDELSHYAVSPSRLSQTEKLEIVHHLDQKGIFLVKGAIAELAESLQTTETTIYRYLNRLNGVKEH